MSRLRQIRQIVYRLKRDFGTPAVLLKTESGTVDLETGAVTQSVTDYPISRAVILPRNIAREFLTTGHQIDSSKRTLLIDRSDVGVEITNSDRVEIEGLKYSIAPIKSDLLDGNYLLELKRVEGQ